MPSPAASPAVSALFALAATLLPRLAHAQDATADPRYENFPASESEPEEQPDTRTGFRLGLRTGFGLVSGKIRDSAAKPISDAVLGQVPMWIDLGGAVSKRWTFSAYFSYGIGVMASEFIDDCDEIARSVPDTEISCTASNVRIGATVAFHGRPTEKLDPWFGMSLGFEWLSIREHVRSQGQEATLTGFANGLEFPSFDAGLDFRLSELIAVGPFIAFTFGRYHRAGLECEGACPGLASGSDSVNDTALHVWSFIGVKGTLSP